MAKGGGGVHGLWHTFLKSTSPIRKLSRLFRGRGGSTKDCYEFPFLRDVELVERSLRAEVSSLAFKESRATLACLYKDSRSILQATTHKC